VFVYRRHCEKVLAQMMKTIFFKKQFLTVKHCLNTVKHRLLVFKKQGQHMGKKFGKKNRFLANFFRGLSFYCADCKTIYP
jgi:hypothetical protein